MLETDYLVIGGGASSLAFVDEIINKCKDLKIIVVDKRAKPGGHWNDAYPFVRLHQPAAWYGVNSRSLGAGGPDLVSRSQILAYYEHVVDDLMSTGRVRFFWQCEYKGDGRFCSLLQDGIVYQVTFIEYLFRYSPYYVFRKYRTTYLHCLFINGRLMYYERQWTALAWLKRYHQ